MRFVVGTCSEKKAMPASAVAAGSSAHSSETDFIVAINWFAGQVELKVQLNGRNGQKKDMTEMKSFDKVPHFNANEKHFSGVQVSTTREVLRALRDFLRFDHES